MAETEVYGLISGPSWLRQSLVADLEYMGYQRNPYDKCIMSLPSKTNSKINEGVILIEVDDILEGGPSPRHREYLAAFPKVEVWQV
eukprot:11571229-Prorocentrum_lima.AAC.1